MTDKLLDVRDLAVSFRTDRGWIPAVDSVNFTLGEGDALGIVGESGSGKSVTALSLLRLHAERNTRIEGQVLWRGRDVLKLSRGQLQQLRGSEIAMVFQDPIHTLNPVLNIADQIGESLRIHQGMTGAAARRRAIELLDTVRIPDAARRVNDYPHQLSGGQRQRVMIAIAIACQPKLLIADEPTTALDVTVQAQIMELLRQLRADLGMSVILISHDLGLVSEFADRVMVMYAGQPIEMAPVDALFDLPLHPYSDGLISAIPDLDSDLDRLPTIAGSIPEPTRRPAGCRFAPRCPHQKADCRNTVLPMLEAGGGRAVRCTLHVTDKRAVA
ncbi:ATP-binding cassette domain-containing protein [Paracoccus sp. S-4012]|uniref:ABC transporter ATP-binding protein n=1 Tax=Paracoccus sp. S-4012 TaxID=2665648 RepID=UPI0012AFB7AC|nr:ABC transporter ATP-binding protein [Paracoccus sp. S-4012]MRX51795.1 ATP-binding cassette domain-containing protein [Paracoccus sp. S-4012]